MKEEQIKNNRILSSCLKRANLSQQEIDNILRLNDIQQAWQLLAEYANNFNEFNFEEKKSIINSFFSSDFYGETVSATYDFFSKNTNGVTAGKELIHIYAYVCVVAEFASAGFPQRLSAIAASLCKVLDDNTLCNDKRELVVSLSSEEREEGFYAYNIDSHTLSYLGKKID